MTTDPNAGVALLLRQADAENRAGRERQAAEILERILAIDPGSLDARYGLALIRAICPRGIDDLETALRIARELLTSHPGSWDAHFVAVVAGYVLGREEEWRRHWEAVNALMPATASNFPLARYFEAATRLEEGDFTAWADYDLWLNRNQGRQAKLKDPAPAWTGDRLDGRKIFLHTVLDGFGDAIQMARYVPLVKAMGGHVTLVCNPRLGRLFIQSGDRLGFDCIMAQGAIAPESALRHEVQASLLSLPALFRTTPETIPDGHWPTVDPETRERWRPAVSAIPGFRVGVCWAGNPSHRQNAFRSFPLAELAPLAAIPGVSLITLQMGDGSDQLAGASFPVIDLGLEFATTDWLDTAAVISQLDLVISPDTAIAHLAGALARPVWLALNRPSEWRWMRRRDDSPWYPTMRLFRQDRLGDWGPVFARMAEEISARSRPSR